MKTNRVTSIVVLVKGILMILIGIIHTIATYFEMQEALKHMSEYWAVSHAVWFGLTGMFFLFIGTIDLLSYAGLKRGARQAWRTALCSSIFPAVCGSIGTYIFHDEKPAPVFPMIILFLGIVTLAVLLINSGKFSD